MNNRAKKRQLEVQKKQAEHSKLQKNAAKATTVNNERLQQTLSQPLSTDNKGFQMMAKMGYKSGTGLGKQADARIEPIGITIKNDRGGLGREAAIAELAAKRQELRRAHLLLKAGIESSADVSTEAYRRRATQKAEERKLNYDLKRCQQTCESLDLAAGISEPDLAFFWPPKPTEETDEEDLETLTEEVQAEETEAEEYSASEQLELLTSYLRTGYTFCYWCGTHYESVEDLDANCPGLTRDEH